MIDPSIRCLIYLLNMRSTRSYFFKTLIIFYAKILFSANHLQRTYFLLGIEETEYAGIKFPINLKHPKKLLLMRILAQKVSIYIRHKKTYKKTKEVSLQNLGVIVIGCIIFQSKLFSCCPKTSAKKIAGNTWDRTFSRKFPSMFPKVLI